MMFHRLSKFTILMSIVLVTMAAILSYSYARPRAKSETVYLVKISYSSDAQFYRAFDESRSVHYYWEDPKGKASYMYSLVDNQQLQKIRALGYAVSVLDQNPDMQKYVIAFTWQDNVTTQLQTFGEVQDSENHFTLLKLDTGSQAQSFTSFHDPSNTILLGNSVADPIARPGN